MSLKEIYNKSITKKVEIFVEIINGIIIHENMGSRTNVAGARLNRGSDVYHTHLDRHPPSARDFMSGLMCTVLYDTRISGVIGKKKIFRYTYKPFLIYKFDETMFSEDSCSEEENQTWTNSFRDCIIAINKNYISTSDDDRYIKKLAGLGIIMSIEQK